MKRAAWIFAMMLSVAPAGACSAPAGSENAEAANAGEAAPPAAAPAATDTANSERFVDQLYARYRASPTDQPSGQTQWEDGMVYTPATIALFARANSFAAPDEVPEFGDGDEICQCQDWENLRVTERRVRAAGEGRAEADVRFENAGEAKSTRLLLERTPQGWRVADLFYDSYPNGLVAALRGYIAEAERTHAAAH